jgi:hypothetical protein
MAELTIKQIETAIKKAGFTWVPGKTPLSEIGVGEQDKRLGLKVEEQEIPRIAKALAAAIREEVPITYPSVIDWRVKDGRNWVEPIRDQDACGSCVAFGTVATIEAQARIQKNRVHFVFVDADKVPKATS